MHRSLSTLLLLCLSAVAGFAAGEPVEINAWAKKNRPPKPEAGGLRLEVSANINDTMTSTGKEWAWEGAFLHIDVALHNVSAEPITVATTAFDEKPRIMDGEPGLERFVFVITSPRFQGKSTVFVAARFTPVVLAPGEYVLLSKHTVTIQDRKRSDALKEVSAAFVVSGDFNGPQEWWRGNLQTYVTIQRGTQADKFIAEQKAFKQRYDAQKEAEKNPNYGATNAARVAALIASADEVSMRGEGAETKGAVIVRDPKWIQQVSAALAATHLPRSGSCFCVGWRTAYFQREGQFVVSIAAIHGNQLRIRWGEGGGDYEISEADWNVVKQVLEIPATANPPPVPTPSTAP